MTLLASQDAKELAKSYSPLWAGYVHPKLIRVSRQGNTPFT
jgi:hypothetical protein